MIKYIGSKRRLVPVLGRLLSRSGADSALDLFTGTTRVAQEFKRRGARVTAVDSARYSHILGRAFIAADASDIDIRELADVVAYLDALPGKSGYFTETFCVRSRYFQPFNGARVDAIRDAIEREFRLSPLYPMLLASLMRAADAVDSTAGVQMAYLKRWSRRSFNRMKLRTPELVAGTGEAIRDDALSAVRYLPKVDLAYLDPPYNQHSYFSNYHVWETLVAWDSPDVYGIACKRVDCRSTSTKSSFNSRPQFKSALAEAVTGVQAGLLLLSYNNEAWISLDELTRMCEPRGAVRALAFDSRRYVGAQIGIYNSSGSKVGRVSHLRNLEYVLISGEASHVAHVADGMGSSSEPVPV